MLGDTERQAESKSIVKNPLLYSSTIVLVAVFAVGWILLNRWQQNRQIDRQTAQQREQKQRDSDRTAIEQLGGQELAIQALYANPGMIIRGQSAQLCYGVANAKTVTLEPQSNPVWPSHARCVDVSPKRSTVYTLTAEDDGGKKVTQTVEVKVR